MGVFDFGALGGVGTNFINAAEAGRKAKQDDEAEALWARFGQSLGGGQSAAPATLASVGTGTPAPTAPGFGGDIGTYANAISGIESGGRYDAQGPTTSKGDRAYGKYQVMGANIPSWTREALGRELTPQQYLSDPTAQDAVFKHRFGGYVEKYGNPQDAASAWFTGRPLAQAGNAKDQLGTTVQSYVSRFSNAAGAGGGPAPPVARRDAPILATNEAEVQAAERATGMTGPDGMPVAQPTQLAEADMPAPGAQPAQFAVPGQTGAPAVASRQTVDGGLLAGMLKNPQTRALGMTIWQEQVRGNTDYSFQTVGDQLVRTNKRTGAAEVVPGITKPGSPHVVAAGATLVGPEGKPLYTAPDKDKSQDRETSLRGEFTKQTKTFNEVHEAYGRVLSAVEERGSDPNAVSPASDIALVFGYMKMLDPGSVVREGEYATAQNAASVPERIRNTYNKAMSGEFLAPEQRQDFVNNAQRLYGRERKKAEETGGNWRRLAVAAGANPDNVVIMPSMPEAVVAGGTRTRERTIIPGAVRTVPPGGDPPRGAPATPKVGDVRKGHSFLGGDPADPASWKKVP